MSDIEYLEKSGLNIGMSDLLEDKKQELDKIRQERMQGVATQIRKKYWPLLENFTLIYFHKNRVAKTYNIMSSKKP